MTALQTPKGTHNLGEIKDGSIGMLHTVDYSGNQFIGKWTYEVTSKNSDGTFNGHYHSGTVSEMDIEDCM